MQPDYILGLRPLWRGPKSQTKNQTTDKSLFLLLIWFVWWLGAKTTNLYNGGLAPRPLICIWWLGAKTTNL